MECHQNGDKFDPMDMESRGRHRKMTIRIGSLQAQMIVNHIESGLSIERTWEFINQHRYKNNEELISISCIVWTIRKMKPKVVPVKTREQGGNDLNSSWSQARYAWSCQLLARFGCLWTRTHGPIEKKFDGTPLDQDGTSLPSIGVRCVPFNYTSKVMIGLDDYKRLIKMEINRVKSLSGRQDHWVESARDANTVYRNDPVSCLKGVGKQTSEVLQTIGIQTIDDLRRMTSVDDVILPGKISKMKLMKYWNDAKLAVDKDAPPVIDHRKHANPYQSKFGDDWGKKIQLSSTFCHSMLICHYIDHMMAKSERVMKETIHEKTWMVYHDALSLMTAKSTKQWMREKGYLKQWMLPSDDLFDNLPNEIKKSHEGKPVGNSPEFMPLDTHLNQDLHESHNLHATVTSHLPETVPRNSLAQHQ